MKRRDPRRLRAVLFVALFGSQGAGDCSTCVVPASESGQRAEDRRPRRVEAAATRASKPATAEPATAALEPRPSPARAPRTPVTTTAAPVRQDQDARIAADPDALEAPVVASALPAADATPTPTPDETSVATADANATEPDATGAVAQEEPAADATTTPTEPDAAAAPGPAAAPDAEAMAIEDAMAATAATAQQVDAALPAANLGMILWLEQLRSASLVGQIALGDAATRMSNAQLGVYFEDHRDEAMVLNTPHQVWLTGTELAIVSPTVEALLLGRSAGPEGGSPPAFECDASRFGCRSSSDSPIGAYLRFAALGPGQTMTLVGVLWFDPDERSARVEALIEAFDGVIDARLDELE